MERIHTGCGIPFSLLSHALVALQSVVSRRLDPMHPGVLSVNWIRAGSAKNVIPGRAEAGATLRALAPEDRGPLREAAREIVEHTARAYGCTGRVEVTEGEPATVRSGLRQRCTLAPTTRSRPGSGATPEILRLRRLRFLRSRGRLTHGVRRSRRRAGCTTSTAPPSAYPATRGGRQGRGPGAEGRLCGGSLRSLAQGVRTTRGRPTPATGANLSGSRACDSLRLASRPPEEVAFSILCSLTRPAAGPGGT